MESVLRLMDEEEGSSGLVARARAGTDICKALGLVGTHSASPRSDKVKEKTLNRVLEQTGTEDVLPRGNESVKEAADDGASMIHDAQAVKVYHGEGAHEEEDPFHGYFVGVEDATGLRDLEASKKGSGKAEIPRIFNEAQQALNRASMLYHETFFRSRGELCRFEAEIRGLTEERDTFKLLSEQREGEARGLRAELEATRKEQTNLSEQVKRVFEVNDTNLGVKANSSVPQVQQKLDIVGKLRAKVDAVKAGSEEWKKNMDRLASEKEAVRAQLASVEAQLQISKERALVQAKDIEELQSRLGSVTSDRERLASELSAAKSEAEIAMANADAMVAVYRSDAEAAQVREKEVVEATQVRENWVAEYAKCQSRRETLEEIHARNFDLSAEIENAKELEAEARVLAFPDDDDTGSTSGSESEGGLEGEDAPGED
ncbi:uncharacterized protein [Nicotiana tomentosiformis]|uniref:uncharacterized protein n=1 Tax=Nicotiana tomentosiformis TaxID=4098 RepID=UPI00388CCDC9